MYETDGALAKTSSFMVIMRVTKEERCMSLREIVQEARTLPVEERKQLIKILDDTLTETQAPKKHSILEFAGRGAEMWDGVDAQEYVNQLRSEWDDHP